MSTDQHTRLLTFLEGVIPALVTSGEYDLEKEAQSLIVELSPVFPDFPSLIPTLQAMKDYFESAKPL